MFTKFKNTLLIISLFLAVSVQTAFAEEAKGTTVTLHLNETSMKVVKDGISSDIKLDTPAKAPRGTTLVPVRAVLEAFDAVLDYDAAAKKVHISKGAMSVTLTLGAKTADVNGRNVTLSEPAVLENNRTLVPIRFISENFGYAVDWEASTKKITISSSGSSEANSSITGSEPVEKEPEIYYAVKSGLESMKSEIDVSRYIQKNTTAEEVFSIYLNVLDENPELFYCMGKVKYASNGKVYPTYTVTADQLPAMKAAFDSKVDEIIKGIIKPGMSEYDRVLAIHDYIINSSRYDYDSLVNNKEIWYNHTAYGVIIKGSGVCESYAKAMNLLAKKAGLDCRLVTGKALSFGEWGDHAWNMVRIDGKHYHVDVTFDDPVSKNGDVLRHNYLNLTDKEISADHTWDTSGKYPKCDSTEQNYFVVNGMQVDNYEDYYKLIETAVSEGKEEIHIKIVDFDQSKYNVPKTLEDIWRRNSYRSYKFSYSIDDKLGVVSIVNIEFAK